MSIFGRRLTERQSDPAGRRWLFVPYDQLSDAIGPLSREEPGRLGIVLVENPCKPARRPYPKQKLALILANLHQFALERAARGVVVRHVVANGPYRTALGPLARDLGRGHEAGRARIAGRSSAPGGHAVGDLMTTRPYISCAAYIDRMSDFCKQCAFDPRETGDRWSSASPPSSWIPLWRG